MTNEAFCLLSEEDRSTNLRAALKIQTAGSLTDDELQRILTGVSLKRQYKISVCYEEAEFNRILTNENMQRMQVILPVPASKEDGLSGCFFEKGTTIAAIVQSQTDTDNANRILIFIPNLRQKGKTYEQQGSETAYCL